MYHQVKPSSSHPPADMFDGTVISKGESSVENEGEVNVEDDETSMYGPPQ